MGEGPAHVVLPRKRLHGRRHRQTAPDGGEKVLQSRQGLDEDHAGLAIYFLSRTVLPERDAEGQAAGDVRGIGEVLQGSGGLFRTKKVEVSPVLLL